MTAADGAGTKIADVVGTVSGDFTSAININGNAADVLITGDNSINVTTTEKSAALISSVANLGKRRKVIPIRRMIQ